MKSISTLLLLFVSLVPFQAQAASTSPQRASSSMTRVQPTSKEVKSMDISQEMALAGAAAATVVIVAGVLLYRKYYKTDKDAQAKPAGTQEAPTDPGTQKDPKAKPAAVQEANEAPADADTQEDSGDKDSTSEAGSAGK